MSQPLAVGSGGVNDDVQIIGHTSPAVLPPQQPEVQDQDISDPDEEEVLNSSQQSQSSGSGLECPICLQSCVHPVELPCRHIFCFLCIKGVVTQGNQPRCAICRQDVPANVLTNPTLKDVTQLYKPSTSSSGFLWYYESRGGGWWEYDVRTMQELEKAYEAKQPSTQLLIAGHLYEIDFPGMIQFRVGNRNLFRRIKRDVPRSDKRGIAGIRLRQNSSDGNPNQAGNTNVTTNINSGANLISAAGGGSNFSSSATGTTHSHPSWSSSGGGRRTRAAGGNSRQYSSSATLQSVIDSVATNSTPGSVPLSSPPGNSVTFFIPNVQNGDGRGRGNGADANADAETETDGDDDESLDEEEDDEDMRFGEEDETTEEEDCDDFDVRDGARAPTSRSDRSTSSSNHNQSPPVRNGGRVSRSSTRASTTTPVDVQEVFPFSPVPLNDQNSGSRPSSSMTPTSPTGNIRVGPVTASNSPLSVANNNGSTCIRIGPSLRITVDYDASAHDDEVL